MYDHGKEYGYDTDNIFVGGYSSGAHLSALLAMDNRYLSELGLSNKMIRAIIPVGGGFDIPHYKESLLKEDPAYLENHINPVFGETHEEHIDASPSTFIDSLITPMLLVSESETFEYNVVFEQLLTEKGFQNFDVLNVHSETHGSLWRKLGSPEPCIYRDYILSYIKKMTKTD